MRKLAYTILLSIGFVMIASLFCVSSAQDMDIQQESSSKTLRDIYHRAEKRKRKVLSSKTSVNPMGQIYYVSADGDDHNDGLSPKRPLRSLDKVNSLDLKPNDGVMFRRGDIWRGRILTKAGVTYSAYGRGEKPRIYGSPYDAAKKGKWLETTTANVYMYSEELPDDVGTLVFNGGNEVAIKVLKVIDEEGRITHNYTGESFTGGYDLKRDLDFYHDYQDKKRIYLCSTKGNPAERFSSIELLTRGTVVQTVDNVHIDNLCVMYGGSHGIGGSSTKSLKVTNCVVGWIGGSVLTPYPPKGRQYVRYGNAVEIYGGCGEYIVDNCYIYQIYDAGITVQTQEDISDTSRMMRNVRFSNNLIERCEMSIEYYLGAKFKPTDSYMENILYEGNILRLAGYGWGEQHPQPAWGAHLKSWWMHYNQAYNFVIRNNVFDRSDANLINVVASKAEWLPKMENNTYIQYLDADGGRIGQPWVDYKFAAGFPAAVEKALGEKNIKITYIEK